MTSSYTSSSTYTSTDVATVMRKFRADLYMMAESSGGLSRSKAEEYAADIELLAQHGCLEFVDVRLTSSGIEQRAARYTVNVISKALSSTRPGGAMWPRLSSPKLHVVINYAEGGKEVETTLQRAGKLHINWSPTYDDISHSSLTGGAERSYGSNGFGLDRQDYSR